MTEQLLQALRREADLMARFALLENKVQTHADEIAALRLQLEGLTRSIDALTSTLEKQQASIANIGESMEFVKKLENMDTTLTGLLKLAKGTAALVALGAFVVAAFNAKDLSSLKDAVGMVLTWSK